jgi:hypothetical protein
VLHLAAKRGLLLQSQPSAAGRDELAVAVCGLVVEPSMIARTENFHRRQFQPRALVRAAAIHRGFLATFDFVERLSDPCGIDQSLEDFLFHDRVDPCVIDVAGKE